jgi:hypothetical protein
MTNFGFGLMYRQGILVAQFVVKFGAIRARVTRRVFETK